MKNQDNNFKRALLKELTGFSYKDKEGNAIAQDEDDDESFDFVPVNADVAVNSPVVNSSPVSAPTQVVEDEPPAYNFNTAPSTPVRPSTETLSTTTISRATIINGGIQTRENIVVEGIVNGDILSKGKVTVRGKVDGNITGYDIELSCEELAGDINCESKAVIHEATKLKGNLYTGKATVVGTIEGNIIARENIELLGNAVVYGDIKATSISVSEGAVIYGMVTIGKSKPDTSPF